MSKRILVSLWMHSSAGRRHLAGIYRYLAAKGRDWDVQLIKISSDLTVERTRQLLDEGLDGVISVCGYEPSIEKMIDDAQVPTVVLDVPGHTRTVGVFSDDEAIGHLAARHFIGFGNFRSFAYVPNHLSSRWSYLRMKGFALELARHKRRACIKGQKSDSIVWLKSLQHPAAVFCASDAIAVEIMHAAKEAGLKVPRDLALLGVDDDELVCDNAHPSLSSIRPGHEACGYAAAETLDKLLRNRNASSVLIPPESVTERESLTPCVPAAGLVDRALKAINEHAKDGWNVDDIARTVGVSRRLLSLRFAELQEQSVHNALLARRLAEVERLLKSTSLKIKDISLRSGFGNVNYLKRLFKERHGITMREFRRASARIAGTRSDKGMPGN